MMEKTPLVSIIIVSCDREYLLGRCLESLFKQAYKNYEVILIDDCSTDGSREFIEKNYPSVKLIRNKEKLGYAQNNNIGIGISEGKYIVTLNNDTTVEPGWLENLVRVAESDKEIGICASKQLNFYNPHIIDSTGIVLRRGMYPSNRGHDEPDKGQFDNSSEIFGAPGASAFYRRDMLNQIGLFDPDYFFYHEEFDLCWRAKLWGWKCVYVPKAVIYHIGGATAGQGSKFSIYYTERNRLLTAVKNLPLGLLWQYLPYILKYELDMLFKVAATCKYEFITARFSALICFYRTVKKRKTVQNGKAISDREFKRWIFK